MSAAHQLDTAVSRVLYREGLTRTITLYVGHDASTLPGWLHATILAAWREISTVQQRAA